MPLIDKEYFSLNELLRDSWRLGQRTAAQAARVDCRAVVPAAVALPPTAQTPALAGSAAAARSGS